MTQKKTTRKNAAKQPTAKPEKNTFNPLSSLRTDINSLTDGVWMDFGGGLRVKVAAWMNENFVKLRQELQEPYKAVLQSGGDIPLEDAEAIFSKLIAETIITDWEGVVDPDTGNPVAYKDAISIVSQHQYRAQFIEPIMEFAQQKANYRVKAKELSTKN